MFNPLFPRQNTTSTIGFPTGHRRDQVTAASVLTTKWTLSLQKPQIGSDWLVNNCSRFCRGSWPSGLTPMRSLIALERMVPYVFCMKLRHQLQAPRQATTLLPHLIRLWIARIGFWWVVVQALQKTTWWPCPAKARDHHEALKTGYVSWCELSTTHSILSKFLESGHL